MPGFINIKGPLFTELNNKIAEIQVAIDKNLVDKDGGAVGGGPTSRYAECLEGLKNLTSLASTPLTDIFLDYYLKKQPLRAMEC
ncbi:hypothetical protein Psal006b_02683 [Piscirickettsia salmonis]|uniref:Phytanoyl-CoA dioxygenase n=2 Tax=Piscirickettsia salmonis TaxID=1238 RepID=A0A1L6TH12_PISSA|nr:hypothetical protein [Piscirickettsia salmonis]AKP73068.1 hypothetical protein PSLF89_1033 [Piscirickettsia salmonis LF-89 = ATCC VR-1361]ALB21716.1 phytanoyl-CoA dioxygenase [Piscirickettsia salmonis]ALY01913.1 hypothetical protein AWE47_02695 [Piscirickettsia salmonis]AMA41421.1 hypothetical protein AWJ11_02680 [Piscirickettsia salmonis]AOS36626.1 hypothetical protein AVM72_15670 [Piscirickettsia salmonis]